MDDRLNQNLSGLHEGELGDLDLYDEFPEKVYILHYPQRNTCICLTPMAENQGIACFSTANNAADFCKYVEDQENLPFIREHTFDDARELAKSKRNVVGLILADDLKNWVIHYVK